MNKNKRDKINIDDVNLLGEKPKVTKVKAEPKVKAVKEPKVKVIKEPKVKGVKEPKVKK
jgi:hypothetical protein